MKDELKTALEQIGAGVEELSADQKKMVEKLGGFETRLDKVEQHTKSRAVDLPGVDEGKEEFSFCRAVRGISTNDWEGAEFERDVFKEARKKALAAGQDSAGGYIVPNQYMADIIELLRAQTVVRELGASVLENLQGSPVEMPKQTGGATGYWVGEGADITESEQTFGDVELVPHKAAALTKLNNRLIRLSNPSAEQIVRNDIAQTLARLIDLAALRGTGASNQPLGIANTSGISTVVLGSAGGEITIEGLYDMLLQIEEANAVGGRMGWAFPPAIWNKLRKLRADSVGSGTGPFLLQPDPKEGITRGTLLGMPYRTSTQIPKNLTKGTGTDLAEIYLANWADLLVGMWGGLEIRASQEAGTAFQRDQTWVRIIQEVDVAVRHEQSFCLVNDAITL